MKAPRRASEGRNYAVIWLHILKEGGWHTVRELDGVMDPDTVNPSSVVAQMMEGRYLERRKGANGHWEYGITKECRLPRFVCVGQVSEALG